MADGSSIEIQIGIRLEAENIGMLGSKKVRYFSPHELLSDLQAELTRILAETKIEPSPEDSIDG